MTLLRPKDGQCTQIEVAPGRADFVHLIEGMIRMKGKRIVAGDGLQLTETPPGLEWHSDGMILIFDMPQERWT